MKESTVPDARPTTPVKPPILIPSPVIPQTPPTAGPSNEMDRVAISLTFAETDTLSRLLGANLFTGQEVIDNIRRSVQLSIDGESITLEPGLRQRLQSRSEGKEFGPALRQIVLSLLHGYVGW